MPDESTFAALREKHARNQKERLKWIDRWAKFVANAEDDDEWGDQLNELINSQIEAARATDYTPDYSCEADGTRGREE